MSTKHGEWGSAMHWAHVAAVRSGHRTRVYKARGAWHVSILWSRAGRTR
jgi:hypothetical protein